MRDVEAIEAYLHAHIPLSAQMGVTVVEAGAAGVRLRAPLGPNVNHRGTVFGGSASALAILAGWTYVHANLAAAPFPVRIVIRRNEIAYDRPIEGTFEAVCPPPPAGAWEVFTETLARRSKARVELRVTLRSGGADVATFAGTYVALRTAEST